MNFSFQASYVVGLVYILGLKKIRNNFEFPPFQMFFLISSSRFHFSRLRSIIFLFLLFETLVSVGQYFLSSLTDLLVECFIRVLLVVSSITRAVVIVDHNCFKTFPAVLKFFIFIKSLSRILEA